MEGGDRQLKREENVLFSLQDVGGRNEKRQEDMWILARLVYEKPLNTIILVLVASWGEWLPKAVNNTKRHSLVWAISWAVQGLRVPKWHEPRQYSIWLYFYHHFVFWKLLIEWNQQPRQWWIIRFMMYRFSWATCICHLSFGPYFFTSFRWMISLCRKAWNEQSRQHLSCKALGWEYGPSSPATWRKLHWIKVAELPGLLQ